MRTNKILISVFASLLTIVIYSCKKDYKVLEHDKTPYNLNYGAFPAPNIAPDNQLTVQGVKLGRMLFYETALSQDNSMSCASCHHQQFAFTDTATFSLGVLGQKGKRQAMTIFNMAWHGNAFFWDGRAPLLRDQSLMPIQDVLEMHETLPNVVAKLSAKEIYTTQFFSAFGTSTITPELMSKAMEQFMNSIVSNSSKYDDYLAGKTNLTAEEERGRFLFTTRYNSANPAIGGAECFHCHSEPNFENNRYTSNGLDVEADFTDLGREVVTGNPLHKAWFKVPSLRNVELSAPYMHDGRFKTLEDVVNHYDNVKNSSNVDVTFSAQILNGGLKLSNADKAALVAFLKTMTDKTLATNPEYSSPF